MRKVSTKENKAGTTTVSRYTYAVNAMGQRTNVTQTGTAFQAARAIAWQYDNLGQVTSADSTENTHDRAYQFDTIGNRLFSEISNPQISNPPTATTTAYTANALNQYTAVNTVNPVHDPDGNATAYPLPTAPTANSTLTWDAENRLIQTQLPNSGPTVQTHYDAQSRRIAETVGTTTTLFIYDGWNVISEYQLSNLQSPISLSKSHLWGIDLSGTLQGAGGVGGLLSTTQISQSPISNVTYVPTYDGNGNVSEYLEATGNIVAHFEYDPFGNTMVNTDTGNQFSYRFSTKPISFETGLYYYEYRYYDPVPGRWPSRDPIGERGGSNLYGFVKNEGVNLVDYLGLKECAFDVCVIMDKSAKALDERLGGVFTKRVNEQVAFLQKLLDRCSRYPDHCCCSKITAKLRMLDKAVNDPDLNFKGLGKVAIEAKQKAFFGMLDKQFPEDCSVRIVFTGAEIKTDASNAAAKIEGISIQKDSQNSSNLPFVPETGGIAIGSAGNSTTLAHEFGHFLGWHTDTNKMNGDPFHSGIDNHIMAYGIDESAGPDAKWCKLACDFVDKKTKSDQ